MTVVRLNEHFPKVLVNIIDEYTHPEKWIVAKDNYTFIYYTMFGDAEILKTLRVLYGITILLDISNGISSQHRVLNEMNRQGLWTLNESDKSRIISLINDNDREILIS